MTEDWHDTHDDKGNKLNFREQMDEYVKQVNVEKLRISCIHPNCSNKEFYIELHIGSFKERRRRTHIIKCTECNAEQFRR